MIPAILGGFHRVVTLCLCSIRDEISQLRRIRDKLHRDHSWKSSGRPTPISSLDSASSNDPCASALVFCDDLCSKHGMKGNVYRMKHRQPMHASQGLCCWNWARLLLDCITTFLLQGYPRNVNTKVLPIHPSNLTRSIHDDPRALFPLLLPQQLHKPLQPRDFLLLLVLNFNRYPSGQSSQPTFIMRFR